MLADIAFSTESMLVVSGLVVSLASVVGLLFRQLIASKDSQYKEMESQRNSYKEIAGETLLHLEVTAADKAKKLGVTKVKLLAPVVPEHNSPTTLKQLMEADLQTMRARLVAATLALGLPAREAAPMETPENGGPPLPHA